MSLAASRLDERARTLTEHRDSLRAELEQLPAPPGRRLWRGEDRHLVARTRLRSALTGAEGQLQDALSQRADIARRFGEIEAVRDEPDGLREAIRTLAREHTQLRNELADREVAQRPTWARDALGERPQRHSDAERWDRAARTLARYRIQYEIPDDDNSALGAPPSATEQRHDYEAAHRAIQQLGRALGRDPSGHEIDLP